MSNTLDEIWLSVKIFNQANTPDDTELTDYQLMNKIDEILYGVHTPLYSTGDSLLMLFRNLINLHTQKAELAAYRNFWIQAHDTYRDGMNSLSIQNAIDAISRSYEDLTGEKANDWLTNPIKTKA